MTANRVVLDTNILLDAFVFNDAAAQPLRDELRSGTLLWLATAPMRDELERVLAYSQIVKRLVHHQIQASSVLVQFDALAHIEAVAHKASVTCKDPDDQKFIDLAVAHRCQLLSKDRAVLCMKKRLLALGVCVETAFSGAASSSSQRVCGEELNSGKV